MINHAAMVLKALGEPTRLRIVRLLKERELCTCEMVEVLNMSQPRISQHMKILKHAGIINERRDGQRSFYSLETSLAKGRVLSLETLVDTAIGSISELKEEAERLENIDQNLKVMECKQSPDVVLV